MGKKIARIFGYIMCGIMLVLTIVLVLSAAAFGASDTVDIFGFNVYMVQRDDIATAPKDSAVIVTKCSVYDITEGKLVLFRDNDGNPVLDYAKSYDINDGTYFITTKNGTVFSEKQLVGAADYCSTVLGKIIGFIKTPFGIFCIAVLPCVVLIVYDIIRAAAAKLPPPKVEPQIKNLSEEQNPPVKLTVKSDGKAVYSRNGTVNPAANADDVLYSYTAKQRKTEKPIIPLTDKKPVGTDSVSEEASSRPKEEPAMPKAVAVGRYVSNKSSGTTMELPIIPKKEDNDAFFSQSAPRKLSAERLIPEEENRAEPESRSKEIPQTETAVGRKSTEILAGKRAEDLLSDEDDSRDRIRYDVDVILAGLEKKNNNRE